VILDMVMPVLKGEEVLKWMRENGANAKVIVSSGLMSELQREKLKSWGIDVFLDKPYRDQDIIATVRKALAGRSERAGDNGQSSQRPA